MAVERNWLAVPATLLTANGTSFGVVTVSDTAGFKVKGSAFLAATGLPDFQVQIQRVISSTQMIVGKIGTAPAINHFVDVSAYTTALNATIAFPEQPKNKIKADDIDQAVYEADPVVAKRVISVDEYGKFFNSGNPMPVQPPGLAPSRFGDVTVGYDSNGNATLYTFYSKAVLQGTIAIQYDSNGNQINYQAYDANGNPL